MRTPTLLCLVIACSRPPLQGEPPREHSTREPASRTEASAPVAPTSPTLGVNFPPGLGFVVTEGSHTFVAIAGWPRLPVGEVSVVSRESPGEVVVSAPVEGWPEDLAAWRELTLRTANGAPCAARGRGLYEVRWLDVDPEADEALVPSAVWAADPRESLLSVEVSVPDGCAPLWAHPQSVAPSQVFRVAPDARASQRALERFHAAADVAAIAAEYARFREQELAAGFADAMPSRWVDYDGFERVTRLQGDRGETFVLVEAVAGTDCDGFGAAVWHLYEEHSDELALRSSGNAEPAPLGLVELDGELLLLGRDWARGLTDDEPLVTLDVEPFVCGC